MGILSYQAKLNLIKPYANLGINSRKFSAKNPNFTHREKWLITYYFNLLKSSGYVEKSRDIWLEKVKFIRGSDKKRKKKGAPHLKGYFVLGANPDDKVRGAKIYKAHTIKEFFPMDFSGLPDSETFRDQRIIRILSAELPKKIPAKAYFTIVLANGAELGQRKSADYKRATGGYKEGQAFGRNLSREDKILDLATRIGELLLRAEGKYVLKDGSLIIGVYLWIFRKQRDPNVIELKTIRNRKKGKRNGI